MRIQILGVGCPKCQQLTERTESAATSLGIESPVEKVTDLGQIMNFDVSALPALAVDGKVKVCGRVPSLDEVKQILAKET